MTRRLAAALAAAGALLAVLPPAGAAAKVAPFGHPCTPQNGVLFCPTQSDAQRVKTFDGVPLDVDVTLPTHGLGRPLPTIVMLHGFPGTKSSFESTTPAPPGVGLLYHYNDNFFAKQGYAVVNYSARGFGRSCGEPDSRSSPGCDRGWFHLADQRFELRDAQTLVGKLVDEGIVDPHRIGVTGVSYGGGSSLQLAFLRDRVRERDGDLEPWRSPAGTRLSIAAAYPRWGWSDLAYSLVPNGRFLDFGSPLQGVQPVGVAKQSLTDALYLGGTAVGYLAPRGADPTADLATWRDEIEAGEPYGPDVAAIAQQLKRYKSEVGVPGRPAPVLMMDGFTDPAFSASEALRTYDQLRAGDDDRPYVSLQLGDLGHFRAGNNFDMYRDFADDGAAFLAHYVKGSGGAARPRSGSVKVYSQGCPKGTLGPGPFVESSWTRLARHTLRLRHGREFTLQRGSDAAATFFDPVPNGDPCSTFGLDAASPRIAATSGGVTLAGLTTVRAEVERSPAYGQIDARLLDVSGGRERLVDYGTYRLLPGQTGPIEFQLAGNTYRFAKGHRVRLELVSRNAPGFLPDDPSRIRLEDVTVDVPTR